MLLRDPRDEEAFEALRPGSRRPRPATAPSFPSSRPSALGRARRRLGSLRRPALPAPLDVLRRGGTRPGRRGRARDREPRALLRRPRRRRGRAPRSRRRRLRRGAPARGDGRDLARRPRLEGRAPPARPRRRTRLPRRRPSPARPARSTASSTPATGCSRRSRLRRGGGACARSTAEPALCSSTRSPRSPRRSTVAARGSTSLAPRAQEAAQVEACLEPAELERVVWAEPEALAWAPVEVARSSAKPALGGRAHRHPRLGDAHDRRGRDVRPPPARARPRPRARRRLAVRLPRAGAPLRPGDDARPARRRFTERVADEVVALLGSRADARSSSRRATAHSKCSPRFAGRRALRGARPGRGAARAPARAVPRATSTPCCSQPRPSGRASTFPASPSRCS